MPNAVETEAFRTLRTALSVGAEVCDRILISSSEPGDGKTTISANLAVAFAQAGKRTLVIDSDLRRPGFSTLLNLKGQLGVADVLASPEPPSESAPPLIHHTEVAGLDILPVGLRRPNPAELLSNKAFVELLAWADSEYDQILIDCPPVLAVSDAQIVGQLVDGAILVVRPEKNHRRSVMRAVESFQNTGCRVLGVVANGLSDGSGGYGYGYGYAYEDGYGHSTDQSTDRQSTGENQQENERHNDAQVAPHDHNTETETIELFRTAPAAPPTPVTQPVPVAPVETAGSPTLPLPPPPPAAKPKTEAIRPRRAA